jgi:dTDP-4-dehydrorhamnose reductase
MKIMITGGGGFVAGNIIAQSAPDLDILAVEQAPIALEKNNLSWKTLDLRNAPALKAVFELAKPEVVVHTAAISDIDYCEAHHDTAESVNVGVTRMLVELCANASARLIYFSSDSVFNGKKGRYVEDDPPDPLHFYGRTKVEGEQIVLNGCPDSVVIRPSLIVGLPVLEAGNSFMWRMIETLKQSRRVAFPKEEIRSPLDVITLSRAVLELAGNDYCGILHLSGNDVLTRYEMARTIASRLGYPPEAVADKKPSVSSGRAPRPLDVSLDNNKAKIVLDTPMLGLDDALNLIISNKGEKVL